MDESRIVAAEAWLCQMTLPWPVRLGSMCYPTRDYVVLKLTDDSGLEGWAIGYTRGTPLLESTQALAGSMPGTFEEPSTLHDMWRRQFAPGWAALVRAVSLFDICVWDLVAKQRNQPLGAVLGGQPAPVPLMAVAGYFIDDRGVDAVIDESVRFADEGFAVVKVMLPGHDRSADEALVKAIREAVPSDCAVAVDLHGMFQTVDESMEYSAWLTAAGVAFIEDPFASSEWREVATFQAHSGVPVASGEDLTGIGGFLDLMDGGVQKVRLDATASGGITGAVRVLAAASIRPVGVFPHVWPHIHAHLAAVSSQIPFVEVVPDYVGADPMWKLLVEGPTYRNGRWLATESAGTGLNVDIEAVERHAVAHWRLPIASQ
jgi:L-alanine-DL-glutamate epimerase-like enolase superfamily enzyme